MTEKVHEIIIVGGGAGGLELATKLGNSLGKKRMPILPLSIVKKHMYGNRYYMKLRQEVLIQIKMSWII